MAVLPWMAGLVPDRESCIVGMMSVLTKDSKMRFDFGKTLEYLIEYLIIMVVQ